jgi:hypothetical protein
MTYQPGFFLLVIFFFIPNILQLFVLLNKLVKRTPSPDYSLQHVVCTVTSLSGCHPCTEYTIKITLDPLLPHMIYLLKEPIGCHSIFLEQICPSLLKSSTVNISFNILWNLSRKSLLDVYFEPAHSPTRRSTCHLHHLCVVPSHSNPIATSIARH